VIDAFLKIYSECRDADGAVVAVVGRHRSAERDQAARAALQALIHQKGRNKRPPT
jgi:hypothetical protein